MAENHVCCTGGGYHRSGNFAGICAFYVVSAVFSAKTELGLVDCCGYGSEVGEGNADYYVAFGGCAFKSLVDVLCQAYAFGKGGIHFPVAGYDVFSHCYRRLGV